MGPVRWNYVVSNLIQVLASMFYMYYIFERFCIPMFRDFTSDYVTPRRIIVSIFGCILPGTLVLFICKAYLHKCTHIWCQLATRLTKFTYNLATYISFGDVAELQNALSCVG